MFVAFIKDPAGKEWSDLASNGHTEDKAAEALVIRFCQKFLGAWNVQLDMPTYWAIWAGFKTRGFQMKMINLSAKDEEDQVYNYWR